MLQRHTPMARGSGFSHDRTANTRQCDVCGRPFQVQRMGQKVCNITCARKVGPRLRQVKKEQDRARRDALKPIWKLETECREIVQEIARIRDRKDGCISCHMGPNYDGQWHGSHYRPAGNHGAVQFHLWNIHKSCAQCNLFKGGNQAAYRPRLIEKIGLEKVEWLESQNQPVKHDAIYREYLCRFKVVMGKRLRRVRRAAKREESA